MFPLICPWTNGWVNNRDAGDLRRIALIMMSLYLIFVYSACLTGSIYKSVIVIVVDFSESRLEIDESSMVE